MMSDPDGMPPTKQQKIDSTSDDAPVKPLSADDLCVVQEELYAARNHWYNLGLKLGLKSDVLDTIKIQCSEDPSNCFRDTLKDYLKTITPSWRALVEALKSPTVNQPQLAEKVEKNYCSAWQPEIKDTLQNYDKSLTNTMRSSTALSSPAPEVKSETENELPSFAMQISTDEQHLPSDYGCGCGECSFENFLSKGCPKPILSMSSFSYLNTKGLDDSQMQILRGRLYREFEVITTNFGSLVYKTCGSLIQQRITVRELVRLLMALGAFQPTLCERPLFEECLEELQAADSIDKVFFKLRGYMSFCSYHIVEYVIDAFGTQQDKENLCDYTAKLNEYSRRSIFECPTYSLARKDQANLVVKLEGVNLERYNLIHLAALKSRISSIIKVTKYTLRLCTVKDGCLQLTFQMPHFVKAVIFPLTDSQKAALKVEGVVRLTCEDHQCSLEEVVELVGTPRFTQPFPGGLPADLAQQSRMPYPLPIPNITGQPIRAHPWHQLVNPDLRQRVVRKIVEAIYPVSDPVALQDRRVTSLIHYAMKVEKAMFETVTSREEYYQLLAEKIDRIRKELEQRRMMKSAMENKRQMGGLPGEPDMPNREPMPPFFGGQQPGGDVRYSTPPTPLGSQALPSAGSGSPKSPSSVDLTLGFQPPFALPPTLTSGMDADNKKDVILKWQHSKLMSPTFVPHPPSPPEKGVEGPLISSRPSTSDMEVEPSASPIIKIQPDPVLRKVFVADELDFALRPVLEAVWNQEPESYPFRQAVDPKSLGIPDYFEIIRHPVDLGTMSRKLEEGEYKSPWEFCKDMWLMFDNAWLYNKKTSRVYKYCSKLSEVFDQYIDDAMKNLGYCCGRRLTIHPQVLYCYGKPHCTIPRDTWYYGFEKYVYCPKCFFEIPGDSISVGDDPMTATSIPKNAFKEWKNDSIDYEKMVECIYCGREVHKICVLHHDMIWPDGYECNKCLAMSSPEVSKGKVCKESKFSAKLGIGSPKPPSSVDLTLGSQPPFALPPMLTSGMDADNKEDVILKWQHSKLMSPTLVPQPTSQPPSDQKPFGGIPSVKNEVQSEHSPATPSVPKPLPDGSGTMELDQPFPSVPAVTTPSHFTVSSVKVPPSSLKGGEPFSEAPLTSSRPSTSGMEVEPGASSIIKKQSKIQPDPALRKVFTAEELNFALRPVLEAVWNQDPDSYPFRQPVDPKLLGVPDYFEIIRHPMDLGTMSRKLEEGEYKRPWEFCKDMWLMFDNAWLFNKKTSRTYKFCSKLSEVFDQYIDDAMKSLGYCCGRRFSFRPQVLYCYGKPLCTIPRDTCYYGHKNRFGKYVYCLKCFFKIPGDSISVGDDPMTTTSIPKNAFEEQKNDSIDYEKMVECIHCGREMHKICVLHHDMIWPDGYQCNKCLKANGMVRKKSRFSAKRLPTTKLSSFLEERVNTFLQLQDAVAGEITVRVVSSSDKTLDTRTNMKEYFAGEFPEQFPYRTKAIFVFEEIDGSDVCFFGMHVQEYGSDCMAPNTRRVYISYLDSVHFFRPRHLRTQVYYNLLIGYLQFCKDNGFLTAHIWACPPSEGDDYIFHCHPVEQKIPEPKRLVEWFKKMLDMGKAIGVVWDYQDIFKHCTEEGINSVTEIPYFEGDFWLNVIEETIKKLDQEAREREASEQATSKGRGPKKGGKRSTNKKGNTRSKSSKMSTRTLIGGDDLAQKIHRIMRKYKEAFFVVTLQPPVAMDRSPLMGTTDPDQLIQCDLMDGRDAFLTMARERHWEFSSLRRARYSTMAMLYELHNQSGDRFVYTCNHCRNHVETRFHCQECDDFDLCMVCYKEVGHVHPMEKLGLGLDDGTTGQDQRVMDPKEQRKAQIQKCIQFLIHASKCRDPACKQPSCVRMKRVLRHTRDCKLRMSGNCSICKQFLLLCYSHARTCTEDKCPVPVCARIKKTFREQQMQQRRRNECLIEQRMANMAEPA